MPIRPLCGLRFLPPAPRGGQNPGFGGQMPPSQAFLRRKTAGRSQTLLRSRSPLPQRFTHGGLRSPAATWPYLPVFLRREIGKNRFQLAAFLRNLVAGDRGGGDPGPMRARIDTAKAGRSGGLSASGSCPGTHSDPFNFFTMGSVEKFLIGSR